MVIITYWLTATKYPYILNGNECFPVYKDVFCPLSPSRLFIGLIEGVKPAAREGVNPAAREGVNPAAREGVNLAACEGVNPVAPAWVNPAVREGVNPAAREPLRQR
jgi:hypothetical protein